MSPVSPVPRETRRPLRRDVVHADVLDAYADGLPHRTSEIAGVLGLSRYNKMRLQVVTSELYRTGRLERVGLLGHGVYRLSRRVVDLDDLPKTIVEASTLARPIDREHELEQGRESLSSESERVVAVATAMLLALSPTERRAAVARAESASDGYPARSLSEAVFDRLGESPARVVGVEEIAHVVRWTTSPPRDHDQASALATERLDSMTRRGQLEPCGEGLYRRPADLLVAPPPAPETAVVERPAKTGRLVDHVLSFYDPGGTPRRSSDVVDAVCGDGPGRGSVNTTICNLARLGKLEKVARGVYRVAGAADPLIPVTLPERVSTRRPIRERAPGAADPDQHEDWPLVDAIQAGDRRAEETMLRKHDKLFHKFCHRYRSGQVSHDDLMQEARIGFLKGLRKAERGRGGSPITYAIFWIRNHVRRYFETQSSDVRVPNWMSPDKRVKRQDDGVILLRSVSMEQSLPGTESERTYEDVLATQSAAPDDDDVIEAARAQLLRDDLLRLVGRLPEREAEVIHRRFLVDDPETLEQVGVRFCVSRERIRQIEGDAIVRLRQMREHEERAGFGLPPHERADEERASAAGDGDAAASAAILGPHWRRRPPRESPTRPGAELPRLSLDEGTLGPLVSRPPLRGAPSASSD